MGSKEWELSSVCFWWEWWLFISSVEHCPFRLKFSGDLLVTASRQLEDVHRGLLKVGFSSVGSSPRRCIASLT